MALRIASALADRCRVQERHESAWMASAIAAQAGEGMRDSSRAARWQEAASRDQARATGQLDEAGARAYSRRIDLRSIQRKGAAG